MVATSLAFAQGAAETAIADETATTEIKTTQKLLI